MSTRLYRGAVFNGVTSSAIALIGALALPPVAAGQTAQSGHAATPTRPPVTNPADEDPDVIVVNGQPLPGSVPGNPTPELVLSPAEIRSYGASNIDELLESLAPELGTASGRGGGQPIVLLNGRRVSSFNEIRTLPTEAILRAEIFTEEVALQYGYSADQRVMNIVLRRRFRANTAEGNAGETANGAGDQGNAELGDLNLSPKGRVNLDGKVTGDTSVTQLERGVSPPVTGVDERSARTIIPASDQVNLTGVWNHVLDRTWAVTSSVTLQSSDSESKVGIDPSTSNAILSKQTATDARVGFTLDGQTTNWMWTGSVAAEQSENKGKVLSTAFSNSDNTNTTYEAIANATGAILDLPAGKVRLSVRGSFNDADLDGQSNRNGSTQATDLNRSDWGGRMTLTAPLTSARRGVLGQVGDISAFVSGSVDSLSDFDAVTSYGGGLTWAPLSKLHFTLRANHAEAAPTLSQLGQATVVTPGVQIYDPVQAQTVFVTATSGGNPALQAEVRQDVTLNASWSPLSNVSLSGSYVHNETRNALTAFPLYTPALEAAFPGRFTRDGTGELVAIDRRAINLPSRDGETARVGITFNQGFGPKVQPQAFAGAFRRPGGGGPPGAGRAPGTGGRANASPRPPAGDQAATTTAPEASPPPPGDGTLPADMPAADAGAPGGAGPGGDRGGGGGGGRGGGGGGFRGGGRATPPQVGRVSFSIFYTRRLDDSVVLAPGMSAINLLKNAALGGDGGGGPDKVEFEGGLNWRGMGLRLNGTWNSGYTIPGAITVQDLTYGDVMTVNARAFFDFNSYPELIRKHPILRSTRIVFRANNLFDAAPSVHDGSGMTPNAYQRDLLAPRGVSWEIGLRKLFQ